MSWGSLKTSCLVLLLCTSCPLTLQRRLRLWTSARGTCHRGGHLGDPTLEVGASRGSASRPVPPPPVTESLVTMAGPRGQKVSKVFPSSHCLPFLRICQSRALTSLATVKPTTCSSAADSWGGTLSQCWGGDTRWQSRSHPPPEAQGAAVTWMCRPVFPMTAASSTSQSTSWGTNRGSGGGCTPPGWGRGHGVGAGGHSRCSRPGARCRRRARRWRWGTC